MSATGCDDVADLLDQRPEDLAPDEGARRAAHLDACAACRDLAGAHALARRALLGAADGPPARFGVREHLLGAFEALAEAPEEKPALARPAPSKVPAVRVRLRCTYCLAPLSTDAAVYCADCLAPVHGVCFEEHGRCAAPGCAGTRMVEPRAPRRRAATGRAVVLASALALVTGAAAWSQLSLEWTAAVGEHAPAESAPPPVVVPPAEAGPVVSAVVPAPPTAPRLRVLYVESQPRWEYRYLKNLLLRDPSLQVQVLLLSAEPGFEQEHSPGAAALEAFPTPNGLEAYDVVILGDVAQADLYAGAFVTVARAVAGGAGLLVIDGDRSGAAWGLTALKTVLPVQHDPGAPVADFTRPWRPSLTEAGRASSLLWLETGRPEDEALLWGQESRLEPLYAYTAALTARRDAQVLLEHPTDVGPLGRRPLLAWSSYGSGRCAWLGFDETWRWRPGVDDRYMARFYGGLVRFVARTEVRHARPSGCTLRLRSGVELEAALQSIRVAQGVLTVTLNDGRTLPLAEVAEVVFVPGEPAAPKTAVLLASGDVLAGVVREGNELEFTLGSPTLGDVRIPLNQTRVVALGDLGRRSLLEPSSWDDAGERLFLKDGTVRVADVRKIDEMLVRYSTSAGQDVVALSALDWVSLTPVPAARLREPTVTLRLVDGSRVRATLLELNWGALRLDHTVLDRVTVAREAVLSLRFD